MNVFLPNKCSPSDIKVLQLSDLHLMSSIDDQLVGVNTEESFLSVLKLAHEESWPPDLIILTGDLSQDSSTQSYKRLIGHLEKLKTPCYVLPGNHDTPNTLKQLFSNSPVSYQPFLHYREWMFAFLNTEVPGEEGGALYDVEINNLREEINAHPDKNVLICLHHQLIPVGSKWLDTMTVSNPEALIEIIETYPAVRGVIHGHVHQSFNSNIANTPLFSAPSTCFQFKPNSKEFAIDKLPPGYRWLRLSEQGDISTDIIRLKEAPLNLDQDSAGY